MATMHYPVTFVSKRAISGGERMVVYIDRKGRAQLVTHAEHQMAFSTITPNATVLRRALEKGPKLQTRSKDAMADMMDALKAYAYANAVHDLMPLDDCMSKL